MGRRRVGGRGTSAVGLSSAGGRSREVEAARGATPGGFHSPSMRLLSGPARIDAIDAADGLMPRPPDMITN